MYNQKVLLEAVRAPTSIKLLLMHTNKTKQKQNPRHILSSLFIITIVVLILRILLQLPR